MGRGGAGEEEPVTTAGPRPELARVARPGREVARRGLMPALGGRLWLAQGWRPGDTAVSGI